MNTTLEGHADSHFDGDLNNLHTLMLEIGSLALDQNRLAIQALLEQRLNDAQTVIGRESSVDALETRIDAEILVVIRKRAPLAKDLRIIMAFSKAVSDIERIGDEAVRLANITLELYKNGSTVPNQRQLRDVFLMGKYALDLLERALDCFAEFNVDEANALLQDEAEFSAEFESNLRKLATFVLEDARNVGHVINLTLIIKILERLGQYSINLAEHIIYLVDGIDVRHREPAPRGG